MAAHITAASQGGARFDESVSSEDRSAFENGIWLCETCGKLVDADDGHHTVEQLRDWKYQAEAQASFAQRGFQVVPSRSFSKLAKEMPLLMREMRADLSDSPFTREFIAFSKNWIYGGQDSPYLTYYMEDHDELLGKLNVLVNYGAIIETTYNDTPRFEFTEDFVEFFKTPISQA